MKEKKIMTKHLKIEKCIKVSNGKKSLSRENLIYKHPEAKDAIDDFYGWLKETNTSTKWFDEFLEKYGDLITGFTSSSDVVIHKGEDLRFYAPLNIHKRPDVIFDLCVKANVPEEWGMLFGTPNQILGVGIICNIGAKEEDVVLDYKVYRVVDINDYNNQIWWNSTPLKTFSWPEGMLHMILDFDDVGIGVMIPGGRGIPEDQDIPPAISEFLDIINLQENPRNIRWITVYLKDLQELITNKKPITSYNYYLREEE
jgi:hypothetical protein